MKKRILFFFIFLLFALSKKSFAIYISEIYPAPKSNDFEWVEVYNDTSENVSTETISLEDDTGKLLYFSDSVINPFSYSIATSSNTLNNSGDTVKLFINKKEVEKVTYSGNYSSDTSFARCESGFVKTTTITKLSSNSPACEALLSPTTNRTTTIVNTTQTPELEKLSCDNIILSEIMPYPKDKEEWVEIYNNNESPCKISNWILDDEEGSGSSQYKFTLEIQGFSYALIALPKNMFNNNSDIVRLINNNNQVIEIFRYDNAKEGFSFAKERLENNFFCLQNPTPNAKNGLCIENTTLSVSSNSTSTNQTPTNFFTPTTETTKYLYPPIIPIEKPESKKKEPIEEPIILGTHIKTLKKPLLYASFIKNLSIASASFSVLSTCLFFLKIIDKKSRNKKTFKDNYIKEKIKSILNK